jgi:hypothetical protein
MSNDRFGQCNYMFITFYFFAIENNIVDIEKEIDKKYLPPLCPHTIILISTACRLLTNTYFPRSFMKDNIMAYYVAFSTNKNDYYKESLYRNTDFQDYILMIN